MIIAIAGISGFVGKVLSKYLQSKEYSIIPILRNDFAKGENHLIQKINNVDILINLTGSPILKRWTKKYKQTIYESRINTTSLLVSSIAKASLKPKVFINASAIGIYSTKGVHNEFSEIKANNFLSNICKEWEKTANKAADYGVRTLILRFGVILSKEGGALLKILPLFKLGLGTVILPASQAFSFIHITDLCRAILFLIKNDNLSGVFNFTSPFNSTNKEYAFTLGKVLKRPVLFIIPPLFLKLMYGKSADVVSKSPLALPERLIDNGFKFKYPEIKVCLNDLINS